MILDDGGMCFQSIPAFASDGKIKFYLADPLEGDPGTLERLKFEPAAAGGVAKDAFKAVHLLGAGAFKKVETGHLDSFVFALDEMARKKLNEVIRAGGSVHIVVAPDDDEVAATYFGAGNQTETNRPRLKIGMETRK
jgi:hypothetical protein